MCHPCRPDAGLSRPTGGWDIVPARVQPIPDDLCQATKAGHSIADRPVVSCPRLRRVTFKHVDFQGAPMRGEVVVMDAAADGVAATFDALLAARFPIAKARSVHHYDGSDDASMADNNTSAFNDRLVTGGTSQSLHAFGVAIDLNPVQNPFIRRRASGRTIQPPAGRDFVNRSRSKPGTAEGLAPIFARHGFTVWGGDWNNPKDYQHFQSPRPLAEKLAGLAAEEAKPAFDSYVGRYRACIARPNAS